ncbi:MAG: hypothetical protein M3O33_15445 [Cyanobacteriota bacterium]|nr:hypothetical protein [Cyanobacteriota bacterium]
MTASAHNIVSKVTSFIGLAIMTIFQPLLEVICNIIVSKEKALEWHYQMAEWQAENDEVAKLA